MRKSSSTAITTQPKEAALGELANSEWLGDRLLVWASQNLRDFSWRRTTEPYSIFIAEFLLQKTGATTAEVIYQKFIARYPTLLSLAKAPLEDIAELLQPLGLHFRATRLQEAVRIIVEKHSGQIPEREAELLKLPGVGLYTARSICANVG